MNSTELKQIRVGSSLAARRAGKSFQGRVNKRA